MQGMESSALMKVAKKEMDKENKMRMVKEEERPSGSQNKLTGFESVIVKRIASNIRLLFRRHQEI